MWYVTEENSYLQNLVYINTYIVTHIHQPFNVQKILSVVKWIIIKLKQSLQVKLMFNWRGKSWTHIWSKLFFSPWNDMKGNLFSLFAQLKVLLFLSPQHILLFSLPFSISLLKSYNLTPSYKVPLTKRLFPRKFLSWSFYLINLETRTLLSSCSGDLPSHLLYPSKLKTGFSSI